MTLKKYTTKNCNNNAEILNKWKVITTDQIQLKS